jgi:hypothetical protein
VIERTSRGFRAASLWDRDGTVIAGDSTSVGVTWEGLAVAAALYERIGA